MVRKQNKKNHKGFSLIELLVVVLIIGILAAVALPQYQLAKDKADFARYQSMVGSLRDAYDEYVLVHNEGTRHFEDLNFSLPDSFHEFHSNSYFDCVADDLMWCCIRDFQYQGSTSYWSASIYCGRKDEEESLFYHEYLYSTKGKVWRKKECLAKQTNKRANRLCSVVGTDKQTSSGITTPLRSSGGYYQYTVH